MYVCIDVYVRRIWSQYQRLGLCIRRGTSLPECTLLNMQEKDTVDALASSMLQSSVTSQGGVEARVASMRLQAPGDSKQRPALTKPGSSKGLLASYFSSTSASETEEEKTDPVEDKNVMCSLPSSDHSLAYTILSTGVRNYIFFPFLSQISFFQHVIFFIPKVFQV